MNPLLDLVQGTEGQKPVPRAAPVEVKNEQSLNLLDQMMKGVQRKR